MGFFSFFGNNYGNLKRYKEIINVLLKYGFEDLVSYLEEEKKYKFFNELVPKSVYKDSVQYTRWEKMRMVCEELGPTYIKFGQIISNRIDLLPAELIIELEKLQDNVPTEDSKVIIKIVEEELEGKISDLFENFGEKPFASASLSQVHRATLKTGEKVAIKIQRPGIEAKIKSDIEVMLYMAEILMERVPSVKVLDPIGLIHNFEDSILKELDFIRESINIQRFHLDFSQKDTDRRYIHSPKVYQEYTTSKVLTMEFIDGIKISNYDEIEKKGLDRKKLAKRLAVSYSKQVFEYGFFHADPHPGNIFAMENNVVCYIDYGMMGYILENDLKNFGKLFTSVHEMDVKKIVQALEDLSGNTTFENRRGLEGDLHEFVHSFSVESTHSNELSTILLDLKDIIVKYNISVPPHFYLLARSLVTFEALIENLDPDLDLEKVVRPYLIKSMVGKMNPLAIGKSIVNSVPGIANFLDEFPRDLKHAVNRINKGEVKVDLNHSGIDPFIHTINRVSKLIVQAIIIASLIIGSSLLIVAKTPPFYYAVSIPGLIGLVFAAIIGISMFRDINKGDHDDWKGWKNWNNKK